MTTLTAGNSRTARPLASRQVLSQTRFQIVLLGIAVLILALITASQAVNAYQVTLELFRGIVEVNSTTVDASERALQYIDQASQAAADYAVLASDTPLYEQAQNNIFRSFSSFRDEMSILRQNLQTDGEREAFIVADTFTYSRFWRHVSDLVAQRSDDAQARNAYLEADNHVRTWINPALSALEKLNYEQMISAGENAGYIIRNQRLGAALPAIVLVMALLFLSTRVRRTVRRYFTVGIDAAVVVSVIVSLIIYAQLGNAIAPLETMVISAYQSISASSRVLVDANAANRAESGALLDSTRVDAWEERFDSATARIEARLCGITACTQSSFLSGSDRIAQALVNKGDNSLTDFLPPLVANVTFGGEANALERARRAWVDYFAVNKQLMALIRAGDTEMAILLNTSNDVGSSQEAFERFVEAMNDLSAINRTVFDRVWEEQKTTLPTNQLSFALIGYLLAGGLVVVGVFQRFREL